MKLVKEEIEGGYLLHSIEVHHDLLRWLMLDRLESLANKRLMGGYELYSSWRSLEAFNDFVKKDAHNYNDFYFIDGINSGSNDYMTIERRKREKDMWGKYFNSLNWPRLFEVNIGNYNRGASHETIEYNQRLASEDGRIFFANYCKEPIYGGNHTSAGYHANPLVQLTPELYYMYRVSEGRYSFLNDAIERGYNVDEVLKAIQFETVSFVSNQACNAIKEGHDLTLVLKNKRDNKDN